MKWVILLVGVKTLDKAGDDNNSEKRYQVNKVLYDENLI